MAVNTDWTGFPNGSDGYLARAGSNPLSPDTSVRVGFFDALAPAGPERGIANSPFQFFVSKAGIYPFRLMYYQTAGSANGLSIAFTGTLQSSDSLNGTWTDVNGGSPVTVAGTEPAKFYRSKQ
jgi:hypothetical protein